MSNMFIGLKIKEQREKQGWTQSDLARIVGVSLSFIGMIESGGSNPSLKTLSKIAKAFKVDTNYFLEETPGVFFDDYRNILSVEEREFIAQQKNRPWITLSKEFADKGLSPERVKELLQLVMKLHEQETP